MGIVSKGKDVEEAIALGLHQLKASQKEVNIEILEQESKGFFGLLGSRPAVVRLTIKNKNSFLENNNQVEKYSPSSFLQQDVMNFIKGAVWVKDGKIYCKEGISHYPTIKSTAGILLYKNNELVRESTALTEKDEIRVKAESDVRYTNWEIEMDPQHMHVILHVKPGFRKKRTLIDQGPSDHLELKVKEEVEYYNHLHPKDVLEQLYKLGVTTGIRMEQIATASETLKVDKFVIAKGIMPQNGTCGSFKISENIKNKSISLHSPKQSTFLWVEKGQIIGYIDPPIEGKPGLSVKGETVLPETVKPINVVPGRGVVSIDQGTKLVSLEAGRPIVEQLDSTYKVYVIPLLTMTKNLKQEDGMVDFKGDVENRGNVEGTTIKAHGNILVHGMASHAEFHAGNRIEISEMVSHSDLFAGHSQFLSSEWNTTCELLIEQFKKMILAIEQINNYPAFKTADIAQKGLGPLTKLLLEKKFQSLPLLVQEFTKSLSEKVEYVHDSWKEIVDLLVNGFLKSKGEQFNTLDEMVELSVKIEDFLVIMASSLREQCGIFLHHAVNSRIYSNGDVTIAGKGAVQTYIRSGGCVRIEGILRGGEVYANEGVEIWEAGTKGGVETKIRVPAGKSIYIQKVWPGTVIRIGDRIHEFHTFSQDILARLDIDNHLLLK